MTLLTTLCRKCQKRGPGPVKLSTPAERNFPESAELLGKTESTESAECKVRSTVSGVSESRCLSAADPCTPSRAAVRQVQPGCTEVYPGRYTVLRSYARWWSLCRVVWYPALLPPAVPEVLLPSLRSSCRPWVSSCRPWVPPDCPWVHPGCPEGPPGCPWVVLLAVLRVPGGPGGA